jgi:hypothetical protein
MDRARDNDDVRRLPKLALEIVLLPVGDVGRTPAFHAALQEGGCHLVIHRLLARRRLGAHGREIPQRDRCAAMP